MLPFFCGGPIAMYIIMSVYIYECTVCKLTYASDCSVTEYRNVHVQFLASEVLT